MFEFCWFISEMIVRIFYLCVLVLAVVTAYNFVNPDPDEDNIMTELGKILLFNIDDEETYDAD